ncbi:MAG: methyltransferase domain-containing protein [Magnetococcales bacterium]|nr:methyltransferase domain-containing protein [Magnetococcales bacterium]
MPLRLNLGCGDKILPGYLNVDVAASRSGERPDLLCDLSGALPLPDSVADEILAVHLIEHFCQWQVGDVLREWLRVLKPGGRLVLECPNLLQACREILDNPHQTTGPGPEGQRTLWVLYGDPAWKDPLMIHRWAYTPQSLAREMAAVGLTDIRRETPQFKLGEPRDMRLVGIKRK